MPRSYLPKDLDIEGVDIHALIDIVRGLCVVGTTISTLPPRVRNGLLASLETHLAESHEDVPPLTKLVIDVSAHAIKDMKSVNRIQDQLRAELERQEAA